MWLFDLLNVRLYDWWKWEKLRRNRIRLKRKIAKIRENSINIWYFHKIKRYNLLQYFLRNLK
jgi:hypothetical protein